MLFGTEEQGVASIGVDDVRFAEAGPVDGGLEDQRADTVAGLPAEVLIHVDPDGTRARGAARLDAHRDRFVLQAPLHEGRGEAVLRSGAVAPLA